MAMDKSSFDEISFRDQLIAGGIEPSSASKTARKTAEARGLAPAVPVAKKRAVAKAKPLEGDLFAESIAPQEVLPALPVATPKPIRLLDERIIKTGAAIAAAPPRGEEMQFMHAIMCQVGLPRSKVEGTEFERKCGGAALSIGAGKLWDGEKFVQQPIPYGTLPRLMLAWMNTYAVRESSPQIPVGDSASQFLRMLGKDTSGGKKGTFTMFRKQVQALSACRMTLGFNADGKAYTYEGKPIKQFEAWLQATDEQRPLWPGVVTFSDDYYTTLKKHAVPIDVRAFAMLKGSALSMDIYTFLADRLHRITGRPVMLYWANLREQFGQEYQGLNADKDFKKKFLRALRDVLAVYPFAKVKQVTGGCLLMASPPPIPYKP